NIPLRSSYDGRQEKELNPPRSPGMSDIDRSISPGAATTDHNLHSPTQVFNGSPQVHDAEQLEMWYDVTNAPPPNSRKFQEYQARRRKGLRTVALTSGNLVLDCHVPDKVLENALLTTGEEFTHMRYTAATGDPDDFIQGRFTLRPALYARPTELFIVMTMYNEDEHLFVKTMRAVMKNVTHLCSRNRSRVWGDRGWEKVVVCVVADGRTKIHPRTLKVLAAMGIYQDNISQTSVNGKPVTAHIYEYTTQVMMDSDLKVKASQGETVPIQTIFCLKEKNAKKLNSHRWFFNAFGPVLSPNVCVLIDVGTKPTPTSIYHLWKAFDRNPNLGGACGEIYADLGRGGVKLINPLVAAQNFEQTSGVRFRIHSVLPGAFSAYRYAALQNISPGVGPLASYFKGEQMHGEDSKSGIFEANMYLAEDRILCFELVAKRNCRWVLKYVKSAAAETDVPDTLPELISQRRRWLNGSFFAAFFAIFHFYQLLSTSHTGVRKALLLFEFFYNFVNMLFSWFALANYYLTFYFLTLSASKTSGGRYSPLGPAGPWVFVTVRYLYIMAIVITFVLSLGNRPQGYNIAYALVVSMFALIMVLVTYLAFFTVVNSFLGVTASNFGQSLLHNAPFRDIVISTVSTYGMYMLSSILFLDPWHMFTSFIQYLLLVPAFVNILMVYAFCNTHDVSWGTKGDTGIESAGGHVQSQTNAQGVEVAKVEVEADSVQLNSQYDKVLYELANPSPEPKRIKDAKAKREDKNKQFRTRIVLAWVMTNGLLVISLTSETLHSLFPSSPSNPTVFNPYLTFLFWSVAAISFVRFIGSTFYLSGRLIWG
ncbi:hypothetical protein L0F63_004064, partial [Massospora cicadina]